MIKKKIPYLPPEIILNIIKYDKRKIKFILLNKFWFNFFTKRIWNNLILNINDKKIFVIILNLILSKHELNYFNDFEYTKPFTNYLEYITNINENIIIYLITKHINYNKIDMIIPISLKIIKTLVIHTKKNNHFKRKTINNKKNIHNI